VLGSAPVILAGPPTMLGVVGLTRLRGMAV
jgi:hypothetical protein